MDEQPNTSYKIIRIVIVVALLSFVALRVTGSYIDQRKAEHTLKNIKHNWHEEHFGFASGPRCHVFKELKLAFFFDDGGADETFDRINGHGQHSCLTGNSFTTIFGWKNNGTATSSSYQSQDGMVTMNSSHGYSNEKSDDQCVIAVSEHGTKLTLADGREFTLDGQTPLWLRCKSDGTIVPLNELPKGFVEFFESPPPNPGLIEKIEFYPEAFQK